MTGPRIHTAQPIALNDLITLEDQASQHLLRVLRMSDGDAVRLFNGDGTEYQARLESCSKKTAQARIEGSNHTDEPLTLELNLGQVISKGDRMDFVVQKATELGVSRIVPLWSERCDVRLKGDRLEKKVEHWRKVAISACEQCGRNHVPEIAAPLEFSNWLEQANSDLKLVLHPHNQKPLGQHTPPNSVDIAIGPEGGFTASEIELAQQAGFEGLLLGPRILRTETAALTALSVLQYQWGDF